MAPITRIVKESIIAVLGVVAAPLAMRHGRTYSKLSLMASIHLVALQWSVVSGQCNGDDSYGTNG
jgi:hypothetical protein